MRGDAYGVRGFKEESGEGEKNVWREYCEVLLSFRDGWRKVHCRTEGGNINKEKC